VVIAEWTGLQLLIHVGGLLEDWTFQRFSPLSSRQEHGSIQSVLLALHHLSSNPKGR
ncbi:mCG1042682, isoform CRA_a, partial [Mus musculus]